MARNNEATTANESKSESKVLLFMISVCYEQINSLNQWVGFKILFFIVQLWFGLKFGVILFRFCHEDLEEVVKICTFERMYLLKYWFFAAIFDYQFPVPHSFSCFYRKMSAHLCRFLICVTWLCGSGVALIVPQKLKVFLICMMGLNHFQLFLFQYAALSCVTWCMHSKRVAVVGNSLADSSRLQCYLQSV